MLYFDVISWVTNYIDNLFGLSILNTPQGVLNFISSTFLVIFGITQAYKALYLVLGVLRRKRKFTEKPTTNRYCFIIAAKDEEKVIGNLVDSIRCLDYPKELIDIYAVADNCTDLTASIMRSKNVHVYERLELDEKKHRKGYALQFLFEQMKLDNVDIEKDFDGYIIVDADNIFPNNFLKKMNNAFMDGYDAVAPYRNSKNFKSSIWAFQSGLNWCRVNICDNRPRSFFGCCTCLTGTGFILKSDILKDGWKWTLLTEDSELTMNLVAENKRIMYVDDAETFDEQPNSFKMMFRQRIRWSKGGFVVFVKKWGKLLKSFLKKPNWSKYDELVSTFPREFANFTVNFLYQILSLIFFLTLGGEGDGIKNFLTYIITFFVGGYVSAFVLGIIYYICDYKKMHISLPKALLNLLLFPFYDIFSFIFVYGGLFSKGKWKHIDHLDNIDVNQIEAENKNIRAKN